MDDTAGRRVIKLTELPEVLRRRDGPARTVDLTTKPVDKQHRLQFSTPSPAVSPTVFQQKQSNSQPHKQHIPTNYRQQAAKFSSPPQYAPETNFNLPQATAQPSNKNIFPKSALNHRHHVPSPSPAPMQPAPPLPHMRNPHRPIIASSPIKADQHQRRVRVLSPHMVQSTADQRSTSRSSGFVLHPQQQQQQQHQQQPQQPQAHNNHQHDHYRRPYPTQQQAQAYNHFQYNHYQRPHQQQHYASLANSLHPPAETSFKTKQNEKMEVLEFQVRELYQLYQSLLERTAAKNTQAQTKPRSPPAYTTAEEDALADVSIDSREYLHRYKLA